MLTPEYCEEFAARCLSRGWFHIAYAWLFNAAALRAGDPMPIALPRPKLL
jgi:hypothetical protein